MDDDSLLDIEEILGDYGGFISVPRDKDAVVFDHYTAKEYIDHKIPELYPRATSTILESCIRYLSLAVFAVGPCPETEIRDRMMKCPLATYAASHWANHVRKHERQLSDELINEIAAFLTQMQFFLS